MIDLSRVIFVDHHAHSMLKDYANLDAIGFRQAFSESRSLRVLETHLPTSISYMDMLRRLGQHLDLSGGEEEILDVRSKLAKQDYANILFDDASIGCFIIDDGFNSDKMLPLKKFAEISERPVFHCERIEHVLEQCLLAASSFDELKQSFHKALLADTGTRKVALKTIVAYRGGMDFDLVSLPQAKGDFDRAKKALTSGGARPRITSGALYHYFLTEAFHVAAEKKFPVQIHCGLGDQDADLRYASPLYFRKVLESDLYSKTDFVFLHCFPFVNDAAFLCSVYGNVYMDISLGPTLASPAATAMFRDALAVAPASKILAATDGHSVPETYWYAVGTIRRALEEALAALVSRQFLDEDQAMEIAARLLHGNARALYQLDGLK